MPSIIIANTLIVYPATLTSIDVRHAPQH